MRPRDLPRFLDLVPDWHEASRGLVRIVLAGAEHDTQGRYARDPPTIWLMAWPRELEGHHDEGWLHAHRETLDRPGVPVEGELVRWTGATARAFTLVHVLLHELGHHVDSMSARDGRCARGEGWAEAWATDREEVAWRRWVRAAEPL